MEASRGNLPTGTVTFLFSDIESSTRLVEELDVATFKDLLEQHHRLLRGAFAGHGGHERGTQGDGFLVVFTDAPSAVKAAVDAQRSLSTAGWPRGVEVRVRMGLHSGQAIPGGDDYVGPDIIRAARVGSAARGGQVLISDATRALCQNSLEDGVTLRYVGEHRLKGLDAPERLYQLVIDGLPSDFPPLQTSDTGVAHLPVRITSFIGRSKETAQLLTLLESGRLITLVGPGGAGKTSLATELAREVADDFDDGAWFVDLASLHDPSDVESAIASSLGIRDQPHRPTAEVLTDHLASRRLLLLLDNYEHLLAASGVVVDLLAAAPGLKILVTSRSSLSLYGEQIFTVPPLAIPDGAIIEDLEGTVGDGAVALFAERARAVDPDFSVTSENVSLVTGICARVDGLPLAIELAASRIRHLTLQEILERLEQHLPVLAATESNRPERQHTLQRTIQWSYELMPPAEQVLLTRLSIFDGPFTLEAAEDICNPEGELGIATLDGLASLERQSLIRRAPSKGSARFDMLETIHDFARQLLASAPAIDDVATRNLEYYRNLAELAGSHLMGPRQAEWLVLLEAEHANLRKAMRIAIDSVKPEGGLRLASSIWRYWLERGHLREGRAWLEALLELEPAIDPVYRAKGYAALGGLAYWLSDPGTTERAYESALSLHREIGDEKAAAEAMYDYAFAAAMNHDEDEARRRFQASMEAAMEVGSPALIARNQVSFGLAALVGGDPGTAISYLGEASDVFRETGDRFHLTWAVGSLGQAHFELGDVERGRDAFLEALRLSFELRNLPVIAAGLQALSVQESAAGHHLDAVTLTGAAEALQETTGAVSPLSVMVRADLDTAREALGDEAVDAALAQGRQMDVNGAVQCAIEILGKMSQATDGKRPTPSDTAMEGWWSVDEKGRRPPPR